MKELFKAVRSAANASTWSKGVELSRQGGVLGKEWSQDEVILTVLEPNKAVNPVTTLWPDDEDWNCDCGSKEDPCEHVVAAVIAIKRANEQGVKLPQASVKVADIEYHFTSNADALNFTRFVSQDGKKEVLGVSLSALASGRIDGPALAPTKEDLTVDHVIDGNRKGGILPAKILKEVIKSLQGCERVYLDGNQVKCKVDPLGATASIVDTPSGVHIKSQKNSMITKVFNNGAVLSDKNKPELHPLLQVNLAEDIRTMLREGRHFGQKEIPFLVSEIVPKLREALPLIVRSEKLPSTEYTKPRLAWESEAQGSNLLARPIIVYGDPVSAKIQDGRLISLNKQKIPIRMVEEERKLKDELSRRFPGSELFTPMSFHASEAISFIEKVELKGFEMIGDGKQQFHVYPQLRVSLPQNISPDNPFEIEFSSIEKGSSKRLADPRQVLNAWLNEEPLVPLLDGGFSPIPKDFLAAHGSKILDLLGSKDESEKLPTCMLPALAELYQDLDIETPFELNEWKQLLEKFDKIPNSQLPSDLKAELRPYQQQGYNWLRFLQQTGMGALLADDMGLGKTLQTIACIQGKTLVIAPTSVLENWRKELEKFRPDITCSIFHGLNRKIDANAQVIISSYALLRMDFAVFDELGFDMLVLDEAQAIKNPRSQSAQAAFSLKAGFKLALSGTPVENKLEDMWSIFNFLNKGLLGSYEHFQKSYVKPILAGNKEAGERLRKRVKPFVLRRLKSQVAKDLPPRTDLVRYCTLSEHERQTYEALRLASRKEVLDKLANGGQVIQALELLLRLRQAACHLGLLPSGAEQEGYSSKLNLILECLQNSLGTDNKCLVFSQWTQFLDLIQGALEKQSIPCLRIDGQTKNRQEIVDQFQNNETVKVLLLSLKAAGVGLNLTAADHVFITDPWWNPAAENQAADRAHRIGQKKPVIVTRLVSEDTVEQKILLLQDKKRALADSVISTAGNSFNLTKEDLLELLV
ncbi:MAG: DEAD/DEAH box helicase [Oligoflexales bacterium]|nr:DEAD/DEAH box helicase [Oligoflexales bacterium]